MKEQIEKEIGIKIKDSPEIRRFIFALRNPDGTMNEDIYTTLMTTIASTMEQILIALAKENNIPLPKAEDETKPI